MVAFSKQILYNKGKMALGDFGMYEKKLSEAQIAEYTRVAHYYYKEGCTQEQIAQRMNMSRQRVNRILSDCLEYGIVHISITASPSTMLLELESKLKEKYRLQDIRVVDIAGEKDVYRDLGAAAAQYLATILRDDDVVGLTRGNTLAAMAEQMPLVHKKILQSYRCWEAAIASHRTQRPMRLCTILRHAWAQSRLCCLRQSW